MLSRITTVALVAIVTGCAAHSPARIGSANAEQLSQIPSEKLCLTYELYQTPNAKAELVRRNAIPEADWPVIDAKKVRIGMSELGLVCSWGYAKVNSTVNQNGTRNQYVYRKCRDCKATYVYTRNGKVTSWQT